MGGKRLSICIMCPRSIDKSSIDAVNFNENRSARLINRQLHFTICFYFVRSLMAIFWRFDLPFELDPRWCVYLVFFSIVRHSLNFYVLDGG